MSTPQGPNGADRGQPGRKPEDRTEQGAESASNTQNAPSPVRPAEAAPKQDSGGASRAPAAGESAAPKADAGPASAGKSEAAEAPAVGETAPKAAKPAEAEGTAGKKAPGQQESNKASEKSGAAPVQPAAQKSASSGPAAQKPSQASAAQGQTAPKAGSESAAGSQGAPAQGARQGGSPTPPWQRGAAAQTGPQQQTTPQTNLPGRGPGLAKSGEARTSAQRPAATQRPAAATSNSAPTRPVVTGTAAAAMTGATARTSEQTSAGAGAQVSKSAVIDGPTRHIERKDLAKDLPDLSSVKHPTASAPSTGETPQVGTAAPAAVGPTVIPAGEPLRATVQVRRIDPWSMLKISSVISVSLFFVWMIAVGLLYGVLAGMGVWDRLNSAFTDIVSDAGSDGLISVGQVFGYATVIGVANTVLLTALATLGAFIYNLCTDLVGGVQVTLADPD